MRDLITIVTSFTVAHSITLISSAFGIVPQAIWFPQLIEMLIALSIVYMAVENIVGTNFERRWMMTFGFGLIHGFGFSFLLSETMQFAGGNLFSSLLAFNVGVELGQLMMLFIFVPLLALLFSKIQHTKTVIILLSALAAHTAWHWLLERGDMLLQYSFEWPVMSVSFLISLVRWGMLLVIIFFFLWLLYELFKRLDAMVFSRRLR